MCDARRSRKPSSAFGPMVAVTAGRLACGPVFLGSDAWPLVVDAGTTIITLAVV
ncbi:low affinity iron permease family protein [Burkholderia pseudomultivorans]|uniref:low affinity iron permease family protein n=1 Tax=Burkholderia pseudomultivorans TaxID=1207504 RepID=UPI0012D87CBD|nr:low affinity iron permease family protein [Burkholderia pseudomultivorans]